MRGGGSDRRRAGGKRMSKPNRGKTAASARMAVGVLLTAGAIAGSAGAAGAAVSNPLAHHQLRFTGVPSNITVSATGPDGAVVRYNAPTAWDRHTPTDVPVPCTPPSGSTFLVGRTQVVCTADGGDIAQSSKSFQVTLRPDRPALTPDHSPPAAHARRTFHTTAGVARTATVVLPNRGPVAGTLGPVRITGPAARAFTQTNDCGTTLAAGASCKFTVTFTPDSRGHRP